MSVKQGYIWLITKFIFPKRQSFYALEKKMRKMFQIILFRRKVDDNGSQRQ